MKEPRVVSPEFEEGFPEIPGDPPTLAILASGSGSNFEAITRSVEEGDLQVELGDLICNNPGARCLERAERFGVASRVIDHREFDERIDFDAAVARHLHSTGADWVAMAGWMRIATPVLVDAFRDRIVNLHPSLLPSFRGAHAIEDALEAGVRMTGCTVHVVTEEVDAGPIVAQAAVPVWESDDVESLGDRVQEVEHWLFPRAIGLAIARSRDPG